ncbi:MAG: HAD family hydrolase [Gammaproteobacteria bacterium]
MKQIMLRSLLFTFLLIFNLMVRAAAITDDPLPSWNNTPVKQHLMRFMHQVTDKKNSLYVPVSERIATLDNDGTLWVEYPIYTQAEFAMSQIKILAPKHPEWKTKAPFKAVLNNDTKAIAHFSSHDWASILAATHAGMTINAFNKTVTNWLATATNPHFHKGYTQLAYQPMLELINYLQNNFFKVYIVTGGGQEFVRSFAESVYGIPPENVIGTAGKIQYAYQHGKPVLIKLPTVLFVDDKVGKPEAIQLFIGRHPLLAIGNSDGDRQMLEWTSARQGAHFTALVHHDDAKREFAYDKNSHVGTFPNSLMTEAKQKNWTVISMKKDWKVIFP